jgi:hypothetical protein
MTASRALVDAYRGEINQTYRKACDHNGGDADIVMTIYVYDAIEWRRMAATAPNPTTRTVYDLVAEGATRDPDGLGHMITWVTRETFIGGSSELADRFSQPAPVGFFYAVVITNRTDGDRQGRAMVSFELPVLDPHAQPGDYWALTNEGGGVGVVRRSGRPASRPGTP